MDEFDAFYRHLIVERGNQPATANHIVSEVTRLRRWLEAQFALEQQPFAWVAVSDSWTLRYLHHRAGYDSGAQLPGEARSLPTVVRRTAQRLSVWFAYLREQGELNEANTVHPTAPVRRPKHGRTADDAEKIIRAVLTESRGHDRTRNWALVSVMLTTDLFQSKLARLDEAHIGFVKGLPLRLALPGAAPVTLSTETAAALQQWLIERRELLAELATGPRVTAIWLATTGAKRGQPLHETALRKIFSRYQRFARRTPVEPDMQYGRARPFLRRELKASEREFYDRRRTFMRALLEQGQTLWLSAPPECAALLEQPLGRLLYGHPVHAAPLGHLHDLAQRYEQMVELRQGLLRAFELDAPSRRFQLPGWYDGVQRIEIETATGTVSERFRRKNLLRHYEKVAEPSAELLALHEFLQAVPDDHLRVRKHFDNFYAHLYRQEAAPLRLPLPDFGVIVTGEDVDVTTHDQPKRAERADKIKLQPDFVFGTTWFYSEARWQQAKTAQDAA